VLAARAAPGRDGEAPQVAATLRVTVRQAVYLAAAGAFAREIRLLPRAPGDHRLAGHAVVTDQLAGG
jgi:pilus assembly protein CpaB